jgi:hypothetical protein
MAELLRLAPHVEAFVEEMHQAFATAARTIAAAMRDAGLVQMDAYPGRPDETEHAFEGTSMTIDADPILAHLLNQHRQNHPELTTITPPNPNPHNRTDQETARWNTYNLGRLHAYIEALNAVRLAAAGKDIGP